MKRANSRKAGQADGREHSLASPETTVSEGSSPTPGLAANANSSQILIATRREVEAPK